MKRVLKLIDMLQDVDVLFEYLVTEAKKDKRESLAEELSGNRNWFIRKMTEYQRTR